MHCRGSLRGRFGVGRRALQFCVGTVTAGFCIVQSEFPQSGGHHSRLSRRRFDLSPGDHPSHISLARRFERRFVMDHRCSFLRRLCRPSRKISRRAAAHRRDRPALRLGEQRATQPDPEASRGTHLDSGCGHLGGDQAALHGASCHHHHHRISSRRCGAACLPRHGDD